MKPWIKYIFSALIIFIMLFNSAGFLFIYIQLKYTFKREAFSRLEKYVSPDQLERIAIPNHEIIRGRVFNREDDREFRYRGKMYDIAKEIPGRDSVIFYCINDRNEDSLHKAFVKYLGNFLSGSKSASSSQKHTFQLPVFVSPINSHEFQSYLSQYFVMYVTSENNTYNTYSDIPTPPPKTFTFS